MGNAGSGGLALARLAGVGCRGRAARREALEQFGGGLVGRVLRHQLAAEGFGQQRRGQAVDGGLGLGEAGFQAVGEGEEGFDAADDFGLLLR